MEEAQRREKFRLLYQAAYPRVLGYALRRTLTPEDAADLVAETFLTAWRRFEELPPGDEAQPGSTASPAARWRTRGAASSAIAALSERLALELEALAPVWRDPLPTDLTAFAPLGRRLRPTTVRCSGWWPGRA